MKGIVGKIALVTGAGSGIGQATALAFAKEGAKVVIANRSVKNGEETVQIIKEAGGEAIFIKTDIGVATEVKTLVDKIVDIYGRLDFGINNAGIEGRPGVLLEEIEEEDFDRIISINLKGIWLSMKYKILQMHKQGGGAIVNMSSIMGVRGTIGGAGYVATKHAIVGLTKAAALENATKNIRVNALCPGIVQTPLLDRLGASTPNVGSFSPMNRVAKPEEIAETCLWLCSDSSSYVTGQAVLVDGGWSAR